MTAAVGQVGEAAGRLARWWLGELAAMVPARLVTLLRPTVDDLVLEFSGDTLVVRRKVAGGETEIGPVSLARIEDPGRAIEIAETLEGVVRDLDAERMRVKVCLPAAHALRKVLDLPAAAERDLRQALGFDMDRLTPFSADDVYYDFRVLDRDRRGKRIRVELVVVAKAAVDRAVRLARDWGLSPSVVDVASQDADKHPELNFLPGSGPTRRTRLHGAVSAALTLLAVVLLAGIIQVPLSAQRERIEELEQQVAQAKKEALTARALQDQIEQALQQGRYILDKKKNHPPFIHVLDELTKILPDNTWLFRLRYTADGEINLFGNSAAASNLLSQIEDSPLFEGVQYRAPVTRDQRINAERFHLSTRVIAKAESR